MDTVALVPAAPAWPDRFLAEVVAIRQALASAVAEMQFEHIGSTAVAGLAAKPIIDLLLIPPDGSHPFKSCPR